jgi:hypothetical protein
VTAKARTTGNMCSPGTMVDFAGKPDPRHCINSTSKTYDGEQWVLSETLVLGDSIVKHIINHDTVLVYTHPRQARASSPASIPPSSPRASCSRRASSRFRPRAPGGLP